MDSVASAVHEVHCCGVCHADLDARNVLLLNMNRHNEHEPIEVVLVDFAFCSSIDAPRSLFLDANG